MTRGKLLEIFENTNSEWKGDNAFKGLLIIAAYFDTNKMDIITAAGHDELYSVSVDEIVSAGISEEDAVSLAKLNWGIDKETDSFICFV